MLSEMGSPSGWRCVRCVRIGAYRAHYGTRVQIPRELLAETSYNRQARTGGTAWKTFAGRVHFESGWGFRDDDPTPELRHAIRDRERVEAERQESNRLRSVKRTSNAEALEVLARLRGAA